MHCLQVAITTSEGRSWGYTIKRSTLQITHPAQERLSTPTGSTSSTQFPNGGVGFLLRPIIFVLIPEV